MKYTKKEIKRDINYLDHAIDYLNRLACMVSTDGAKRVSYDAVFALRREIEHLEILRASNE